MGCGISTFCTNNIPGEGAHSLTAGMGHMNSAQRNLAVAICVVLAVFTHLWFVKWGQSHFVSDPNAICFVEYKPDDPLSKIVNDDPSLRLLLIPVNNCFGIMLREDTNPSVAFFLGIIVPIIMIAGALALLLRRVNTA